MPQTPDPQTRNAVTARIITHVTAGWPRLGEPEVRYRGRYCYVAGDLGGVFEAAIWQSVYEAAGRAAVGGDRLG